MVAASTGALGEGKGTHLCDCLLLVHFFPALLQSKPRCLVPPGLPLPPHRPDVAFPRKLVEALLALGFAQELSRCDMKRGGCAQRLALRRGRGEGEDQGAEAVKVLGE